MSRAFVDLRFAPHWAVIDPAREFLQAFFACSLTDERLVAAVGVAAHELMENAIRYSPNDQAHIRVEIDTDGPIRITVENDARPEHIPRLVAEVGAIATASDPAAYYHHKLDEATRLDDGASHLGLARVHHEAAMHIECTVEGQRVRVVAERRERAR